MAGRSSGRSRTRSPLKDLPYPEVKACLSQELFLPFVIYMLARALRGVEQNEITTSSLPIPGTEKRV